MKYFNLAGLLSSITVLLGGCVNTGAWWWEEEVALITSIQAQGQAQVNSPIILSVRVALGSSSCNKVNKIEVTIDESQKEVHINATKLAKKSNSSLACSGDSANPIATASFTPTANGTYRVIADNFQAIQVPYEPTPSATIDVLVTAS